VPEIPEEEINKLCKLGCKISVTHFGSEKETAKTFRDGKTTSFDSHLIYEQI